MKSRVAAPAAALVLVLLPMVGCGSPAAPATPPASLSISEIHAMADSIGADVDEATEVFCDPAGDAGVANCYVGLDTADEAAATRVLCGQVLPITEEHTSGNVNLFAFNAADDQVTVADAACDEP